MKLHPSGVRWGRRSGQSSCSTPNLATKAVFNGAAFCARGALCHVESVKKHNIYTFFFYNLMYVSASTGSSFGRTSRRRQLVVISWGECAVRSLRLTDRAVNQFPRPPQQQINHDILQRSRTSLHHFFFSPTRNWKYLCGGEIVPICGGSMNVLTNYSCQHIVAAPWHFGS